MNHLLDERLAATFALYDELGDTLDGDQLRQSLPVPSNPIGLQLWCVIGARQTWTRAMASGQWGPFRCSIGNFADTQRPEIINGALSDSAREFQTAAAASPEDELRTGFKLDLLMHESQHLGQLLRYLLGLGIEVPPGWRQRFNLKS